MTDVVAQFDLDVEQVSGYEFRVRFDKEQYAELMLDEPAPLGRDVAPNAARILAAAVANCLSASLVFCLSRKKIQLEDIKTRVHVELVRNEKRRLRIGKIAVTLHPKIAAELSEFQECLGVFEDFCVVTQSVREGLKVDVQVQPV
ncbi:MAG: OsmC family protein [Polyangiaceae bacterium]